MFRRESLRPLGAYHSQRQDRGRNAVLKQEWSCVQRLDWYLADLSRAFFAWRRSLFLLGKYLG